jgi:F-type H+-transporting ATPase subunit delta
MSVTRIASRYAKSLIELAQEQKVLEPVNQDMDMLRKLLKNSVDLVKFLRSPIIQYPRKKRALEALLQGKVNDLSFRFIDLLAQKNREGLLPEIVDEFALQYRLLKQISNALIITAGEITPELQAQIKTKLEQATVGFSNVEVTTKVDPELIGGFVIEFEGHVYDASVRHELEKMRKAFRVNQFQSQVGR